MFYAEIYQAFREIIFVQKELQIYGYLFLNEKKCTIQDVRFITILILNEDKVKKKKVTVQANQPSLNTNSKLAR